MWLSFQPSECACLGLIVATISSTTAVKRNLFCSMNSMKLILIGIAVSLAGWVQSFHSDTPFQLQLDLSWWWYVCATAILANPSVSHASQPYQRILCASVHTLCLYACILKLLITYKIMRWWISSVEHTLILCKVYLTNINETVMPLGYKIELCAEA